MNTCACGCGATVRYTFVRGHSKNHFKDGRTTTPEYKAYRGAKARCNNPNDEWYPRYGGRGILFLYTDFAQFLADVGPRPHPSLTLDRMNNDGNYEPGNCHWATRSEQARNRKQFIPSQHRGRFIPQNNAENVQEAATEEN